MDRFSAMSTFALVVDQGSFAGAARHLQVDQAMVTRQIAALEKHLGVKLLERTTRSMRLTDAGEAYLARCRDILSNVAEAEAAVGQAHQAMAGRVRLALPTLFGKAGLADQLAELHQRYPDLTLDVAMLDRATDPVAEGFDVVIADASLGVSPTAISRRVLSVNYLLCASPAYLARMGTPQQPEDLLAASHLMVSQWQVGDQMAADESWTLFRADGEQRQVPIRPALRANNFALSLEAVRLGMGIGRFTPRMLREDLLASTVQQVLPDWHAGLLSFNLIYPSRRLVPSRVRLVIDAIVAQFEAINTCVAQSSSSVSCQIPAGGSA